VLSPSMGPVCSSLGNVSAGRNHELLQAILPW
jgi:hypothetical protein